MATSLPSTRIRRTGHLTSAIFDQKFCTNTRRGTFRTLSIQCKSGSTMARWFLTTTTIQYSTSGICQRPSRRRWSPRGHHSARFPDRRQRLPGTHAHRPQGPGSDVATNSQHHQHETVKVPMAGRLFVVDSVERYDRYDRKVA